MSRKEIHNAIVTRNIEADEATTLLLRGAVYFNAPGLFDGEYPLPAEPCFPFASANGAGFFVVPKVDDEIEIEVAVDDPNNPDDTTDAELPEPRWRCMVYSKAADIAEEFKVNYPFRMGWKSNSGHFLLFDDKEGFELVKLFHKVGTFLEMTKDGDLIENVVRDRVVTIVRDLVQTITGKRVENITGDSTETIGGKKVFNITGDCNINCNNANIVAAADVSIMAGGNCIIMAAQIQLNGTASEATSKASHLGVIDLITGAPIVPTTTVLLDV